MDGTISPGNDLALSHNLYRDNLTFFGQFIRNGYIYVHADYPEYFGGYYRAVMGPAEFESADGNVLIAYSDDGNTDYGSYVICCYTGVVAFGEPLGG